MADQQEGMTGRQALGFPAGAGDLSQGPAVASRASAVLPVSASLGQAFASRIRTVGEATPDGSTSSAGARAQMQVLPGTAANPGFGVAPARDSSFGEYNRVGEQYAQALLQHYGGNIALASAAYNAGPGRVNQWIQEFGDPRSGAVSDAAWAARLPVKETRNYALRMLGAGGQETMSQTQTQAQAQTVPQLAPASSSALTPANPLGAMTAPAPTQESNPLLPAAWGVTPGGAPSFGSPGIVQGSNGQMFGLIPADGDPFAVGGS
jgi:hypothetical protein